MAEKLDLYQQHRDQYRQKTQPVLLELPPIPYLAITGRGKPGAEAFGKRMEALFGMAYTLKFMKKDEGNDFVVAKLEGLWYPGEEGFAMPVENPGEIEWDYTLLIRVPEFVDAADLDAARKELARKGKEGLFEDVRLEVIEEGVVVQALHVGPYHAEAPTLEKMHEFAHGEGYEPEHGHHEIYLSDPRRTNEAKLKTLLRTPLRKVGSGK